MYSQDNQGSSLDKAAGKRRRGGVTVHPRILCPAALPDSSKPRSQYEWASKSQLS